MRVGRDRGLGAGWGPRASEPPASRLARRILAASLPALVSLFACATGESLRLEGDVIRSQLDSARRAGAYRCAPRELAMAESHLDFLRSELDQGNAVRATAHRNVAKQSLATVLQRSKGCHIASGPSDRDGDGVPDSEDACPDTPGPVEYQGCPDRDGDGVPDNLDACLDVPGAKENKGCPWADRDQDGVLDKDDACPDTPGPVENKGCPWPDRDGDGVLDKDDECPDVPGPASNKGCPEKKLDLVEVRRDIGKIEIKEKVYFDTGKSTIKPASFGLLTQVAQALKNYPTMKVLVEGHTDSVGGKETNLKLSDARAESVREFLIGQGVESRRLTAQGFGLEKPIDSNRTAKGRENNRRVEFTIINE